MSRPDSNPSTNPLAEALRDLIDLAERHHLDASVGDDDFQIIVRARQALQRGKYVKSTLKERGA